MITKTIFEKSQPGRVGYTLPKLKIDRKIEDIFPAEYLRKEPPHLPEVSELDVMRHYIELSNYNHCIEKGFYPLGSCTMKYNPKINDELSATPKFTALHPEQPEETIQGILKLMYELKNMLAEISGMADVSLQPVAGAQGEFTGITMIRAYHEKNGNARKNIILPDSAHGTNPATSTLNGYKTVEIKSNDKGMIDLSALKEVADEDTAAFMLTNPNTLGIFEEQVEEIAEIIHNVGAFMYLDGANLNALLGIVRPGDIGFDVVHFNLHKTFSTPHGGGGPGGGPIGVIDKLRTFLPIPQIEKKDDKYHFNYEIENTIGKVHTFYGNVSQMIRAYVYLYMLGKNGLKRVSENAVINANYLMKKIEDYYDVKYKKGVMHEFVASGSSFNKYGVHTIDIAKRLLDFGFHAPTVYFPLIVPEALMIEPTETETKETLDKFADAMINIAKEAEQNPQLLKNAPTNTPIKRLDEVRAVKKLNVRFKNSTEKH